MTTTATFTIAIIPAVIMCIGGAVYCLAKDSPKAQEMGRIVFFWAFAFTLAAFTGMGLLK